MFKDIDIVVCSNEQLANEARTGTKLAWAMPWKEEENKVNSLEEARLLETPPENEGTK